MSILLECQLEIALNAADALMEDMSMGPQGLEAQIDLVIQRLAAAKRALGIANRLTDEASRRKHRSRIMGMLNQLRASLWKLQDELEAFDWAH